MAECYIQIPAEFGAANTHIENADLVGASGITDSSVGTFSCWFLPIHHAINTQVLYRHTDVSNGLLTVFQNTADQIRIEHTAPGAGGIGFIWTSTAAVVQDEWHHILFSWRMDATTARANFYLDDSVWAGSFTVAPTVNKITNWTPNSSVVGSLLNAWQGCLGDLWVHHAAELDVSSEAVRRTLIDANGFPVDAGGNGELVTGVSPIIYLSRRGSEEPNDFRLNKGLGTDYQLPGVSLGNCPTTPSQPRPLDVTKSFSASDLATGERATMTIFIDNECNVDVAAGVSFTDTLPDGLVVATPPSVTNDCMGTVTAEAGASAISLTGGSIPAGGSCTITLAVESNTPNTYMNSLTVSSSNLGTSEPATANILYWKDKVNIQPDEHLTYRPDARIYANATTHSPKTGRRLMTGLDRLRDVDNEDDFLTDEEWF
jgi:uncharacterized repeat protein (TIGR01451 family)